MSMQYADRFNEGKAAVISILKSLQQGDEAAIVTFADSPGAVKPLTTDLDGPGDIRAKHSGTRLSAHPFLVRAASGGSDTAISALSGKNGGAGFRLPAQRRAGTRFRSGN